MPLINEGLNNQNAEQFQQQNFNQNAQANDAFANSMNQTQSQKGLFSLPPALMQVIPWIPLILEMTTGQKIPQMTGTMGEIQSSLQQVQFQLSQVSTQQQQLYARLESLENNASSQLNSLSQQLVNANNNFRLIANETKRSLELSSQPKELASE